MSGLMQQETPAYNTQDGVKLGRLPGEVHSSRSYANFLINAIREDRHSGKPFLAYLAFTSPHDRSYACATIQAACLLCCKRLASNVFRLIFYPIDCLVEQERERQSLIQDIAVASHWGSPVSRFSPFWVGGRCYHCQFR